MSMSSLKPEPDPKLSQVSQVLMPRRDMSVELTDPQLSDATEP